MPLHRSTIIRLALVAGAYGVGTVELLGAFHALTRTAIWIIWAAGIAGAVIWWFRRGRKVRWPPDWRGLSRTEWVAVATVAVLGAATLLLALLAEPNNYDSQTYHLARIERWTARHDVGFFATAIHRQVTLSPGAEYLILHLRLLTGGDRPANLVQWLAGALCVVAATRITAQLGGGRRAQLITAVVLVTVPMLLLQATSTQNDLVLAGWVACLASLCLDAMETTRTGPGTVLALGTATGLIAVTKASGLLAAGPLLVWWVCARWYRGEIWRSILAAAAVPLVAAALVGPFLYRTTAEFGHPLGPPFLRQTVVLETHDPASILVNGLRQAHTALDTPLAPPREVAARTIDTLADGLGVDSQGSEITFPGSHFPATAWYPDEDRAAFPIQGALLVLATAIALFRPAALGAQRRVRGYALTVAATALLFAAQIKWQPWGNRLLLFAVVLGTPLAGLWLARLWTGRRPIRVVIAAVLALATVSATLTVAYGYPRRYVGSQSVFTLDPWQTRFVRRSTWADEFQWAAQVARDRGARRIGLVEGNDSWEYPWWLLLRDRAELVPLQSILPKHPAGDPASVDLIVCTGSRQLCAGIAPPGWRVRFRTYVGVAEPPGPG